MKLKNIAIVFASTALLSACQSDLLDLNPTGSIGSGNMWTTENLVDMGVTGIYQTLTLEQVGYGFYHYDQFGFTTQCRDADEFTAGTVTSSNSRFTDSWKQLYEGIHRANDGIANLTENAPVSDTKRGRLMAECKILRAYFYYRLNSVYRGVPMYLTPIEIDQCTQGREGETVVWDQVVKDLTDAINEPNLPNKYDKGSAEFGHVTKGVAYALRGKAYMWMKEFGKAEADFAKLKELGYSLFTGGYKKLFKEANEQSDEMIFSVQQMNLKDYGSDIELRFGNRSSLGYAWNTYMPSTDFVDSYEMQDGTKFDWDKIIPGFSKLTPMERSIYFYRDGLTAAELDVAKTKGAKVELYLPTGNEARIKKAYESRDPRLNATVITPYSEYYGGFPQTYALTYTMRYPYRDTNEPTCDLKTDTQDYLYYLYRKFVSEGTNELNGRDGRMFVPIDYPLIRFADVLLMQAEAINEQKFDVRAVALVNQVRERAGVALLQTTDPSKPTFVNNQVDLRQRIRNERRWEFNGEAINYFDELRWQTLKDTKFATGSGTKEVWGRVVHAYSWRGDYFYKWAVPQAECEKNTNLIQNDGWIN
jgi:starch-binding outer membrane protein, SusD/RagB family